MIGRHHIYNRFADGHDARDRCHVVPSLDADLSGLTLYINGLLNLADAGDEFAGHPDD
jgi:hypothetical protein